MQSNLLDRAAYTLGVQQPAPGHVCAPAPAGPCGQCSCCLNGLPDFCGASIHTKTEETRTPPGPPMDWKAPDGCTYTLHFVGKSHLVGGFRLHRIELPEGEQIPCCRQKHHRAEGCEGWVSGGWYDYVPNLFYCDICATNIYNP